jgi:ABC-type polysaccharide/polyol phosphate export permease
MSTNKKYWLRGLIAAVVGYVLSFLILYICLTALAGKDGSYAFGLVLPILAVYFSPVILLGLFFGWIYGKINK